MKKEVIFVIFIIMISSVSAQLADSPWPMYHSGVKHGGQSSIDTSHVTGHVKWTFETGGGIESSPTIGEDGTIYVGSHDNKLYAVNPDGTEKWNFYVGEPVLDDVFNVYKGILSTPAIAKDGTIYFSSLSDIFFALNPDGTEKWRHELPITSDTWTSPVIGDDGTIYTGSARRFTEGTVDQGINPDIGGIFAFNPNGTLKWKLVFATDMGASPAITNEGVIFGSAYNMVGNTQYGYLIAVNPDGTEKWRYTFDGFTESSPTVAPGGTIYLGSSTGALHALNPDGTEKWSYQAKEGISAIPAVGKDGTVYVGDWTGIFFAFNPVGTIKWTVTTPKITEAITSSAAIGAEGTIYFGAADGIYALNPDGTEKWHYIGQMGAVVSSPSIGADGTVYVGGWDHKLYAFGEGEFVDDISEKEQEEKTFEKEVKPEIITKEFEKEIKTERLWNPKDEGVDCFEPESGEIEEKCDMYCYDNPKECPEYFDMKGGRGKGFFTIIFDWFKSLFR